MDSVMANIPAELRRGCAEKNIRSWRKMLDQTVATNRIIPAWAMIAVPRQPPVRNEGRWGIQRAYP